MAQKFLYIVDHFIPFPASEYGGVWNVIAESDESDASFVDLPSFIGIVTNIEADHMDFYQNDHE